MKITVESRFSVSLTLRKDLSMSSNLRASSGSCDRISPPTKIPSRYNHLRWQINHSSRTSLIRDKVFSHTCTAGRNGPTNLYAQPSIFTLKNKIIKTLIMLTSDGSLLWKCWNGSIILEWPISSHLLLSIQNKTYFKTLFHTKLGSPQGKKIYIKICSTHVQEAQVITSLLGFTSFILHLVTWIIVLIEIEYCKA